MQNVDNFFLNRNYEISLASDIKKICILIYVHNWYDMTKVNLRFMFFIIKKREKVKISFKYFTHSFYGFIIYPGTLSPCTITKLLLNDLILVYSKYSGVSLFKFDSASFSI